MRERKAIGNPTGPDGSWEGWEQLDPIEAHRARFAPGARGGVDLRDFADRVRKVNQFHDRLHRLRGMTARHVRREEDARIEIDTIKAPGRTFGPTPLRMLLPSDGRAARPLDVNQRVVRYQRQNGFSHLTASQLRRVAKKRHAALARLGRN